MISFQRLEISPLNDINNVQLQCVKMLPASGGLGVWKASMRRCSGRLRQSACSLLQAGDCSSSVAVAERSVADVAGALATDHCARLRLAECRPAVLFPVGIESDPGQQLREARITSKFFRFRRKQEFHCQ